MKELGALGFLVVLGQQIQKRGFELGQGLVDIRALGVLLMGHLQGRAKPQGEPFTKIQFPRADNGHGHNGHP